MADAKETAGLQPRGAGRSLASPRLLVAAVAFYGAVFCIAVGWRLAADGVWPWRPEGAVPTWPLPGRIAAGIALGTALVVASRVWTARSPAAQRLARELGSLVEGLGTAQAVLLAAVSGIAEEAFFRGALQPRVGLLAASLLFALAHFHPRRELRVWSLSAGVAGLAFGAAFAASGDLIAPALAHATVNAVNLRWLARARPEAA